MKIILDQQDISGETDFESAQACLSTISYVSYDFELAPGSDTIGDRKLWAWAKTEMKKDN